MNLKQTLLLGGRLILAFLYVLVASCVPSKDIATPSIDDAFMKAVIEDVSLASEGGKHLLTVPAIGEWTYYCNAEGEWLSLEAKGTELHITAQTNNSGKERQATILLLSGQSQRRVMVSQSGVDFDMNFSEAKLDFSPNKGMKSINVTSNTGEWRLEPLPEGIDWLRVKGQNGGSLVIIEVDENNGYESREANLLFSSAKGEKKDLRVSQAGITKYFLPYEAGYDYRPAHLLAFERERGNILQAHSEPIQDRFNNEAGVSSFYTKSRYMPNIQYLREVGEVKYTVARMVIIFDDPTLVEHPEVEDYAQLLLANDYQEIESPKGASRRFLRKDDRMLAEIKIMPDGAVVDFAPRYPQERDYPTFASLPQGPAGFMALLNDPQSKVQQVRDYETRQGGEKLSEVKDKTDDSLLVNLMYLTKKTGAQEEAQRGYFFYTPEHLNKNANDPLVQSVQELALYFNNHELGIRRIGIRSFLTREFEELATRSGFSLLGGKNGTFYFTKRISDEKLLAMYVSYGVYANVLDGRPHLAIGFFHQKNPEGSTGAAQAIALAKAGKHDKVDLFDKALRRAILNHKTKP